MKQVIHIDGYWTVIFFYELDSDNIDRVLKCLRRAGCSKRDLTHVKEVAFTLDTGFTFSNPNQQLSIVGISKSSSGGELLDTVVHELDHVQMAICNYYDIIKDSEEAAYLMGYIAKRVYNSLITLL